VTPYYQDEAVCIYHGDCREVLPRLLPPEAVVTDPPYGIGFKSHGQHFRDAAAIHGDESTELAEYVRNWARGKPVVMFFSPYRPLHGWRSVLAWDKGEHVGIGGDRETCWKRDFELIGVSDNGPLVGGRDSAVLRYRALFPPPTGHVAEKPEALMSYLIRRLGVSSVLDPFMGSGTTLVAAKRLGRKAIGIERERKYCDLANERLSQGALSLEMGA
jgi:DNA modification methylase